jgi:hypothetical protein
VRRATVVVVLLGSVLALPAVAPGRTASFSGSCKFAGPIEPTPPITAVPKPGAHFSYSGSGSCTGSIPGPISVRFTNVSTAFDTCEFGPDLGLSGTMTIGSGPDRVLFQITINLPRLALAGPFSLTAAGGGRAVGVAQFEPPNSSSAPQQCASGGIGSASLAASFNTVSALVGTADPVPPGPSGHGRHRRRRDRQRPARAPKRPGAHAAG